MSGNKKVFCLVAAICILFLCAACSDDSIGTGELQPQVNTDALMDTEELQTKVNTDVFYFSADEFTYELCNEYVVGDYELLGSLDAFDDGELVCKILSPDDMVGAVTFISNGDFLAEAQKDSHTITGIMAYVFLDVADTDVASEILLGIVGACDPTLDSLEVLSVCSAIMDAAQNDDHYEHNGIQYSLNGIDNSLLFSATLDN